MSLSQTKTQESKTDQEIPLRSIYVNTTNQDGEYISPRPSNTFLWTDNSFSPQDPKSSRYIKYLKDQNNLLKQQLDQEHNYLNNRYSKDNPNLNNSEFSQQQVRSLQFQLASLQDEFDKYKDNNSNQQKETVFQIENLINEKQKIIEEIEKLSNENRKLNNQLYSFKKNSDTIKIEDNLNNEIQNLNEEIQNHNSELAQVKSQLASILSEKEKLLEKIEQLKNENSQLKKGQSSSSQVSKRSVSPKPTVSSEIGTKEDPSKPQTRIVKRRSSTPKADKMTFADLKEISKPDNKSNTKKRSSSVKLPQTKKTVSPKASANDTAAVTQAKPILPRRSASPKPESKRSPKSNRPSEFLLTEESEQYVDLNAKVQVLTDILREKAAAVSRLRQKHNDMKRSSEELQAENEELEEKCKKYDSKNQMYHSTIIRQKNYLDERDKKIDELQIKQSKVKKLIKIANKVKNTNTLLQERNRKLEQKLLDSASPSVSRQRSPQANYELNLSPRNDNFDDKDNFDDIVDEKIEMTKLTDRIDSLIHQMMIDSAEKSHQIDELDRKISQLGVSQRDLSQTVGQIQNHIVDTTLDGVDEINLSD